MGANRAERAPTAIEPLPLESDATHHGAHHLIVLNATPLLLLQILPENAPRFEG